MAQQWANGVTDPSSATCVSLYTWTAVWNRKASGLFSPASDLFLGGSRISFTDPEAAAFLLLCSLLSGVLSENCLLDTYRPHFISACCSQPGQGKGIHCSATFEKFWDRWVLTAGFLQALTRECTLESKSKVPKQQIFFQKHLTDRALLEPGRAAGEALWGAAWSGTSSKGWLSFGGNRHYTCCLLSFSRSLVHTLWLACTLTFSSNPSPAISLTLLDPWESHVP